MVAFLLRIIMELTTELAEQIVFYAKKIIVHPLNVMDAEGTIIAATNPSRRYQKHSGAILAINQKTVIEITDSMSKEMLGTQPGINLPIMFRDELVGVIGISGPPNEVRPLGELVRMAAEMTVENAYVLEQAHWNERKKKDLLLQWIENKTEFSLLESLAIPLHVDLHLGYVACILKVKDGKRLIDLHTTLKRWDKNNLSVELDRLSILVLLKNSSSQRDWNGLKRFLSREAQFEYISSIGKFYPDPKEFYASYKSAKSAIDLGSKLYPHEKHYNFGNIQLPCLVNSEQNNWQKNLLLEPILKLDEMEPVLKKTLLHWFDCNLDNTKTSEELFIHRNTLRYRLKKISEVCGLDLDDHASRVWMYIGLINSFSE